MTERGTVFGGVDDESRRAFDGNSTEGLTLETVGDGVIVDEQRLVQDVLLSGAEVRQSLPAGRTWSAYIGAVEIAVVAHNTRVENFEKQRDAYRTSRAQIEACLWDTEEQNGVYTTYPHLQPERLQSIRENDTAFVEIFKQTTTSTSPRILLQNIRHPAGGVADSRDIALALAQASTVRHSSDFSVKEYRQALNDATRVHAGAYLLDNIGLFVQQGVRSLGPDELSEHGLHPETVNRYNRLHEALPDDGDWIDLDGLEAPPLVISQLAADVINFNDESALPVGGRILRTGEHKYHDRDTVIQNVNHVTTAVKSYLAKRYEKAMIDPKILPALVECDLAERQGFLSSEYSPAQEQRTIRRTQKIFSKTDRKRLPTDALAVFDQCVSHPTFQQHLSFVALKSIVQ